MSKHEDYCECSMPDRSKFCRVYCGKPRMETEVLKLNDEDGQYYPYETWFERTLRNMNQSEYKKLYTNQWMPSEDKDDSKS